MAFELPQLPYAHDALTPTIDEETMQIHHGKHHQAYVTNLNAALEGHADLQNKSIEDLVRDLNAVPEGIRTPVRNNGGGHLNHSMFWKLMKPGGGGQPTGQIAELINASFGSFDDLKTQFAEAGVKRFGSGWVWLVQGGSGLQIVSTPNQDNPLMSEYGGQTALLGNDVWEHAYYLTYRNRRPDYLKAWWDVVNWDEVNNRLQSAG